MNFMPLTNVSLARILCFLICLVTITHFYIMKALKCKPSAHYTQQ